LQAETINLGIGYEDVKKIALDIFKDNFIKLSEEASIIAKERVEEITEEFLVELYKNKPESIDSMRNPDMQLAIYTVQKEYARTGDKNLSDMLVDILVDRATKKERDLKQIVLDESLSIVPKLTSEQIEALTIIFIVKYARRLGISNLALFNQIIDEVIKPFTGNLTKNRSCYQHLEYCGCGAISSFSIDIEEIFKSSYRSIFSKGFSKEEILNFPKGNIKENQNLVFFESCWDKSKIRFIWDNTEEMENILKQTKWYTEEEIQKFKEIYTKNSLTNEEIKKYLLSIGDYMNILFDIWNNSEMKHMTLTSVGIAIAQANFRRKTGKTIDLSIWIK
jgi:hypothetical protein